MANESLPRLRGTALSNPPRLVLVDPEIPQNTGNAARLAVAMGCPLHLVGTLGFRIDDKAVRRAGIDYWHLVDLHRHVDLPHFQHAHPDARLCLFSAVASQSLFEARFRPGDALVFGKESTGLPLELLEEHPESCYALPTIGPVRSLNLANCAAVVLFEAMRQLGAFDHCAPG